MEMMAKVTLVREAPQGLLAADATVRMVLMLHLTPQGRVDGAAWDHSAAPWPVTRTSAAGAAELDQLIRFGTSWGLRNAAGDDDPLSGLDIGLVRPGEMITLRAADGSAAQFRIVAVEPGLDP
jgi:hypothetical protein